MKKIAIFLAVTALFWGAASLFFFQEEKKEEETHDIQKLALLSTSSEELKGEVIAEWLGLSVEQPTSLGAYNLKEGIVKLLKPRVIRKAQIYKLSPSTLVVQYTLRDPFAKVLNWKNVCLDEEGIFFSFAPFFTPKELPQIAFPHAPDLDFCLLEEVSTPASFALAKQILKKKELFHPWELFRVDLSRLNVDHPYGGEIILTLKQEEQELIVRLWHEGYESRLLDLPMVFQKMKEGIGVDLRLPSRIVVF